MISVTATHVFKAGLLQDLSVLLDGVEVVVPALDVLLEVVAVWLVTMTVSIMAGIQCRVKGGGWGSLGTPRLHCTALLVLN